MAPIVLTLLLSGALPGASTTWYVTMAGNDDTACGTASSPCRTIQYTVDNRAVSGDDVRVGAGLFSENIVVGKSISVVGVGAALTVLDGGGSGTVVTISSNQTVFLSGMTVKHGFTRSCGAGISNNGNLTLSGSVVTANTAKYSDVTPGQAGGICNNGALSINTSTISGNTAETAGGIINLGTATLFRSTVSGNSSASFAGGIQSFGRLAITDSTISGNSAVYGAGIHNVSSLAIASSTIAGNTASSAGIGGGIYSEQTGTVTAVGSIIADNTAGYSDPDCSGKILSLGYNLLGNTEGCTLAGGPDDLTNMPAGLSSLGNHGGPTATMALQAGSPAIDAGNPAGCFSASGRRLPTDQRGARRVFPEGGRCDIGAFELRQ